MSESGEGNHNPKESSKETNEATRKSDEWMKKNNKIGRWLGHGILTGAGEMLVGAGALVTGISTAFLRVKNQLIRTAISDPEVSSVLNTVPKDQLPMALDEINKFFTAVPLAGVSLGLLSGVTGAVIGWQGVKNSPSKIEKTVFWGSKAAVFASYIMAPALIPVAHAISTISTAIGMRHRK